MRRVPRTDAPGASVSWTRRISLGCLSTLLGAVSCGMVAVLLSKVVAYVTHQRGCQDVPSCNWLEYWAAGAAVGAITLPMLVFWVLGKPSKDDTSERGMQGGAD